MIRIDGIPKSRDGFFLWVSLRDKGIWRLLCYCYEVGRFGGGCNEYIQCATVWFVLKTGSVLLRSHRHSQSMCYQRRL